MTSRSVRQDDGRSRGGCTSASRRRRGSMSMRSGGPGSRPAIATTGSRGRGRSTWTTTTAAFLLDPDGNSAEAVHHGGLAWRQRHRPPLDPGRRRGGVEGVLRDGRAGRRDQAGRRRVRSWRGSRAPAARSRCVARASRPRTCTWRSRPARTRRSTSSIAWRPRRATATTAARASGAIYHPRLLRRVRARPRRPRRGREPQPARPGRRARSAGRSRRRVDVEHADGRPAVVGEAVLHPGGTRTNVPGGATTSSSPRLKVSSPSTM